MNETEELSGAINEGPTESINEPIVTTEPEPAIAPPSDHIGTKEALVGLISSWKRSLCLKIFSGFFLIIFILMIVFAVLSTRDTGVSEACLTKLHDEEKNVELCAIQKQRLIGEINSLRDEESHLRKEIESLSTKEKNLETKHQELVHKHDQLTHEISELNDHIKNIESEISTLRHDINTLEQQIRQADEEIAKLKEDVKKKDAEIASLKKYGKYFMWGLIGSGGLHIVIIADEINTRSLLSEESSKADKFKKENEQINKNITEIEKKIKTLREEHEKVYKNLTEHQEILRKCETEKVHIMIEVEDCNDYKELLHNELKLLPLLAVEQNSFSLIKKKNNMTTYKMNGYDSEKNNFDKTLFLKYMKMQDNWKIIIVNTTHYRFFGAGFKKPWDEQLGGHTDDDALTFSVNHRIYCHIVPGRIAYQVDEHSFFKIGSNEFDMIRHNDSHVTGTAQLTNDFICESYEMPDPDDFYNIGTEVTYSHLYTFQLAIEWNKTS